MIPRKRRIEAALAKALAVAFWLGGWALAAVGVWDAIDAGVLSVSADHGQLGSGLGLVLDYIQRIFYPVPYLVWACVLLVVSAGIGLAYKALGYLRELARSDEPSEEG